MNIAARLQTLAQPGGICVSGATYEHVRKVLPIVFTDLGTQQVKNIEEQVRAYAASGVTDVPAPPPHREQEARKPLPLPDKPSIAVLPFQNMSGDPEQDYFADGMVEEIITALSRFKSPFVIARNSSFTYKGKAVDVRQVGRELGVRYVLEGSVRKAGNRVRITGQLVEAATGAHLWADRFDGALEDVFRLQDEVTTSVVGAIVPRLDQASHELFKRKPPENWNAYDHYLRGRLLLDQLTLEAINEAEAEFRKAIALEPTFGLAYACAGYCTFVRRGRFFFTISDAERHEAVHFANRATELAGDDDQALGFALFVLTTLTDDYRRCVALAERAVTLNPNSSMAWVMRGWAGVIASEPLDRPLEAFARTIRLNPFDALQVRYAWFGNSCACLALERYAEGAEWASKMLDRNPSDAAGLAMFIENAALAGRTAEAEEAVVKYRTLYPNNTRRHFRSVYVRNSSGPWTKDYISRIEELMDRLGLPE